MQWQDMYQISPDIEQWLLQDRQVLSRWRNIARHIGLTESVLDMECWVGGRRRRKGWRERDKLEMLLRMWKEKKPDTYNIHMLKNVLAAEGLADMWMWINIITQDIKHRPHTRLSSPATSPTPTSPWSRYLYSSSPSSHYSHASQSTYPESDCTSHSLSSGAHSPVSRPSSQLSDYKANSTSSPSHHLSTSCPSSPHTHRRHSPLLYRPDLIQLSSPRLWVRQREEERQRGRNTSTDSIDFECDISGDNWDILKIIEDKTDVNKVSANKGHNAKKQNANCEENTIYSKIVTKVRSDIKEDKNTERLDRNVIARVNEMNDELVNNTFMDTNPNNSVTNIDKNKANENKVKNKVKTDKGEQKSYEEHFDFLLGMIQESVKDLNV